VKVGLSKNKWEASAQVVVGAAQALEGTMPLKREDSTEVKTNKPNKE